MTAMSDGYNRIIIGLLSPLFLGRGGGGWDVYNGSVVLLLLSSLLLYK